MAIVAGQGPEDMKLTVQTLVHPIFFPSIPSRWVRTLPGIDMWMVAKRIPQRSDFLSTFLPFSYRSLWVFIISILFFL